MFHRIPGRHSDPAVPIGSAPGSEEFSYERLGCAWLPAQDETDGEPSSEPQFWRDWDIERGGLDAVQEQPEHALGSEHAGSGTLGIPPLRSMEYPQFRSGRLKVSYAGEELRIPTRQFRGCHSISSPLDRLTLRFRLRL
jgi:hypothetical protein